MLEKDTLGDCLHVSAFAVTGDVSLVRCGQLVAGVIKEIKMTMAHESVVFSYPVGGKGGEGFSLVQPLVESFSVFDSWPNRKIPGAYLVIASCKSYDIRDVITVLKSFNLKVHQTLHGTLGLPIEEN